MIALVVVIQIALPLALLLWLALTPARSGAGRVLQALGTGTFLLALALVGQWAVPGWWLPWVYGGLWLAAALAGAWRERRVSLPLLPGRRRGWVSLIASIVLLAAGGWYGVGALAGRSPPPTGVVDVSNPFGPGRYMVANGGSRSVVNGHMRTLDPDVERFKAWRGQSYAVDFFGTGSWGRRARGWQPSDPAAYVIFGAALHAPCGGVVMAAEGGMPDFEVPQQDLVNRLGNHVILRCGEADIVLAHMRRGTVTVAVGQAVARGDRLGEVGNSGASAEPHLHIHAQHPPAAGAPPISGDPLHLRIDGRFLVRNDRLPGRDVR